MKYLVEYKMHGKSIPYFIANGGYFLNNGKMLGVTFDSQKCYIPETLAIINTKEELKTYLTKLNPNITDKFISDFLTQLEVNLE